MKLLADLLYLVAVQEVENELGRAQRHHAHSLDGERIANPAPPQLTVTDSRPHKPLMAIQIRIINYPGRIAAVCHTHIAPASKFKSNL